MVLYSMVVVQHGVSVLWYGVAWSPRPCKLHLSWMTHLYIYIYCSTAMSMFAKDLYIANRQRSRLQLELPRRVEPAIDLQGYTCTPQGYPCINWPGYPCRLQGSPCSAAAVCSGTWRLDIHSHSFGTSSVRAHQGRHLTRPQHACSSST